MDPSQINLVPEPNLAKACKCCKKAQPPECFAIRVKDGKNGKKGEPTAICKNCMEKDKQRKRRNKDDAMIEEDISCDLDWFSNQISEYREKNDNISLEARVNTEGYIPLDLTSEERAKGVALLLDGIMDLHWM